MDETGEAPLPTGPVSKLKELTLEVPPPALPEFNPTVPSEQARCPSPTSSSPEPEQQRTALVCPKCRCQHVRRSSRRGPIEHFRSLFGFYPYRCVGCSSRFFLRTSSNVPRPKRTTGPIDQFRGIRGLCALLWYEYFSQVFLHPRKWLAKRRRRSHDTRQEMFIWGSGIVVFLALFSLLIWVTGRK